MFGNTVVILQTLTWPVYIKAEGQVLTDINTSLLKVDRFRKAIYLLGKGSNTKFLHKNSEIKSLSVGSGESQIWLPPTCGCGHTGRLYRCAAAVLLSLVGGQ